MPNLVSVKRPTKWVAFFPGQYAELRHTGTVEEKAAVFTDLIDAGLADRPPVFEVNKENLTRGRQCLTTIIFN
jgi:hypothetical protein